MKEIEDREDVRKLVYTFYGKVRKDELLGPIFNSQLSEEQWPSHLEKLTDFWETNLFRIPKFKGNPMGAHQRVDAHTNRGITQKHFATWLRLWKETLEELFEGERAERAMEAARRMSTPMFIGVWGNRPENRSHMMYY
ncbi:MAG: group III truncated hemoglobin [Brumimicrobium sp.]